MESKKDIRGASLNRKKILLITLASIAVVLAALLLAFFLAGFRYKKLRYLNPADGSESTVSFLGFVDRKGNLKNGTIFYEIGKASVDRVDENTWILRFSNGDVYTGELDGLQRSGYGTMTYKSGEKYVGSFSGDKFHGQGSFTYANGDSYSGSFAGGKKSGEGLYVWAPVNGKSASYQGSFSLDQREGYGVYTEPGGTVYKGCFHNDLREDPNASVTIVTENGEIDRFYGSYKNDRRDGFGYYFYANGDVYVGEFKNNTLHGKGIIYRVEGSSFSGTFENGSILSGTAVELSKEEADAQREALSYPSDS